MSSHRVNPVNAVGNEYAASEVGGNKRSIEFWVHVMRLGEGRLLRRS